MATIQIRDIPEEAYEAIRRRARVAGQSIQAYMRDQVIAQAGRPTKTEAIAAIRAALSTHSPVQLTAADIAEHVHVEHR